MNNPQSYHLVYNPGGTFSGERIISLLKTDNPNDVMLRTMAAPGSIAMQLDATCEEELRTELKELGFSHSRKEVSTMT